MKINWLLEYHYVRGNYANCHKIMEEKKSDNDLEMEYSTYIKVSKIEIVNLSAPYL